jgi:hypothetical protein
MGGHSTPASYLTDSASKLILLANWPSAFAGLPECGLMEIKK